MKIFKTSQVKDIDAFTIQHEPVASIDLMERAAGTVTDWIVEHCHKSINVKVFAGPGNNGGDACAVARLLAEKGFGSVNLYLLNVSDRISPNAEINRERLFRQNRVKVYEIKAENDFPQLSLADLVIDGLFGSGLSRPLEGLALRLVKHINKAACEVVAIDIPSGLFGEDNSVNNREGIIHAAYTLTFQFPKLSFFFAENNDFTGKWQVMPIGLHDEIIEKTPADFQFVTDMEIREIIQPRRKFSHKGTYGHALLIAGSHGMMGAAVLASRACMRGGAGLVTVHIPHTELNIIQTTVPEALSSLDKSGSCFTETPVFDKFNAIAVGPGTGTSQETGEAMKKLLETYPHPMVIDADAINLIGMNKEWLDLVPKGSILTPHPKEFERIAGPTKNSYNRIRVQMELSAKLGVFIVLKGAHTSIAFPDGRCFFNSTGNPGMATGGSGDVLTGLILALLAQGYSPEDASLAGVYLHGLAADLAVEKHGENSLIASDIINYIGKAFLKVKNF
ncbi:MAG: NAD(P)H-hydrate dehydratase [Bacteroidales bacterium]|nr:NAD(P)H-hydrate dehydratase [Bacteroidales bacterium]